MKKLQVLILTVFMTIQGYSQTDLMNVKSWAYWLQTIDIQTIVNDTSFNLIVMDYSADGLDSQKWTTQQLDYVKSSGKYAISYISIGEAEDYRYYWQSSWDSSPPSWLGPENPDWPGNYAVRYWDLRWQSIVFDYLETVMMQGFDGIYMDLIEGYYYWSETNPEQPLADSLMCQFVIDIRNYCDSVRGDNNFILLPQNGGDVWNQENVSPSLRAAYFNAINGIGVEDVFFPGSLDEDNDYHPDTYRIGILQEYLINNKQVFAIDYLTDPAKITQFVNAAIEQNFVPYVCSRPLDYLCGGIPTGLSEAESKRKNDITIYPNPASDFIEIDVVGIQNFESLQELNIYNSLGERVISERVPSSDLKIDVSPLPNGIYTVVIQINKIFITREFVVVR